MSLDNAKQTFVLEARELLKSMEDALLSLEAAPDDKDTVDALFRAVHTIKGSSGMFELEPIVSFTHVVESVLTGMRNGKILIDDDLNALLLSCCDHIGTLVDRIAEEGADPDAEMLAEGDALLGQLHAYTDLGQDQNPVRTGGDAAIPGPTITEASVPARGTEVKNDNWHISLRFGEDVLRSGMDPLSFLRYLKTLGEVVSMNALFDSMPENGAMDPESCYLGLEMDFKSSADKKTIIDVFEFLRNDCTIRILPPHSRVIEYIQLINALPEDKTRLGELLIGSGALTEEELEEGLQIQRCPAGVSFAECIYKVEGSCDGQRCLVDSSIQCRLHELKQSGIPHQRLGSILVGEGMVQREIVDSALEKQKQTGEKIRGGRKFIRVQADKLDHLINLVGELVIAGASASLLAQRAGDAPLQEAMSSVSRLVDEIRGGALQMRMVPIGETFDRFKRLVHDLGRELHKEINLVISGAETELDKSVTEKISDPLTHLVRNAMDHGIERATQRVARGKPEKGTVRLNAYHDSGSIVIEVSDDGGGLDREKILEKASEQGLVGPDQSLSDREIYNLIFEPGFTTTDSVTSLSGRGVGMDVVRRGVEALRGTTEIESQEGVGTTVRIRLPLTLAIIEGFLMGVGDASYVVPLDTVVECVELEEKAAARGHGYINLRGEVLPLLGLREQFREAGKSNRRKNIVVVHYAGKKAGLVVDRLMGEFQTVIRPLGKIFSNLRGVSGTTILGSGEVALILDVPALVQQAVSMEPRSSALA